jgi:uroporphyrinogen decarboxylase
MTGKERLLTTLRFRQPDRPPHFETMFELEREAFGLAFPPRTAWESCTAAQKERMIASCVEIYERIVERYRWDGLAVYWPWSDPDGVAAAKRSFGERIMVGGIVGESTWSIDHIRDWERFSVDLAERPAALHEEARAMSARAIGLIDLMVDAGADFVLIVNDVAFNAGTFVAPSRFRELVTPYLAEQVRRVRDRGALPFVHTDGNIMGVLDDYLSLGAACFQSVDPMARMDIAEMKRRCGTRMALMGNVQCSLLQEGPREAIRRSALYCLESAAPGGGYIFGTSNTVFPGMPLSNYEYMLEVYREFCAASISPEAPGGTRK